MHPHQLVLAANMANNPDTEAQRPFLYAPLPENSAVDGSRGRRPFKTFLAIFLISAVVLLCLTLLKSQQRPLPPVQLSPPEPRGVAQGVSPKSNPPALGAALAPYNWTNAMFNWQRSAFHFQPEKNWMNDPDGPLYYKGWYHLFYQYNPDSAVWGNITWGHAVSSDLIHWLYLPFAMVPDNWYDINGVWTGSASILPDGRIVMLYTGDTSDFVQVQNLAYPANLSDPLLLEWVKYPGNPVLVPPPGIGLKDFRDPTTAWQAPDGKWRVGIGSKVGKAGVTLVYETRDFMSYELTDKYLHSVPGTGMWECVDFFPVSVTGTRGLDTSAVGNGIKHVLKASLDDTKEDVYALGTYDPIKGTWVPENPEQDVGLGLRVDYGKFYASKSFYEQHNKRRILWGWTGETDSEAADLKKGWASLQTIPRSVWFDAKTGTNIIQWPVEEIESLRLNRTVLDDVFLGPGTVAPLHIGSATQLDIFVEFEIISADNLGTTTDLNGDYSCKSDATVRNNFGPFGVLVLANGVLSELTPVFFRPTNATDGSAKTYFCTDQTRSSKATDVLKPIYGSTVPVLAGEKYSARILVDHSIVESFAQGGRSVITSRIYPTEATDGAAKLFLFNNATAATVKASLTAWQMNSAFIRPFPLDKS